MFFPHDWQRRNQRVGFIPNYMNMQFTNYTTDIKTKMMEKHPEVYPPEDLLHHLNMLENPLQKNLADAVHGYEVKKPLLAEKNKIVIEEKVVMEEESNYPSLSGIGNFFSGVFNMITGGTFRRAKLPTFNENSNTNNCKSWLNASAVAENTTCTQSYCRASQINIDSKDNVKEMADCKTAIVQCEDKIARVKSLLASKAVPVKTSPRLRRPKKLFVQPKEVIESFIEVPVSDDLGRLASDATINCVSLTENVTDCLTQAVSEQIKLEQANMKLEIPKAEMEIPKTELEIPKIELEVLEKVPGDHEIVRTEIEKPIETDMKTEILTSCEDKMTKLKALINERRKNNRMVHDSVPESESSPESKTKPIQMTTHNHKYKKPNRITGGRIKTNLRKSIEEDMAFANELAVNSQENSPKHSPLVESSPQSLTNSPMDTELQESPIEYFNEVTGRFHKNSTTESEDSFQIVFTDSPQNSPKTKQYDCDSEDSFIIFEDHDLYTTRDVFGDHSETDYSTEDELEGKISHAFSRTVSDLTDESLYEDPKSNDGKLMEHRSTDEVDHVCEVIDTGLMIDDAKKLKKKEQPPKKVRFADGPPKVHVMRVWSFAARQARIGNWEQYAIDRDRFKRRIADVDMAISWVLKPQHRSRVKFQRFMPWWHAERRKEAAAKKLEEERRKKEEEERKAKEEELRLEEIRKEQEELRKLEEELKQLEEQKKSSNFVGSAGAFETESSNGAEVFLKEDSEVLEVENKLVESNGFIDVEGDFKKKDLEEEKILQGTNVLIDVGDLQKIKIGGDVLNFSVCDDDEEKTLTREDRNHKKGKGNEIILANGLDTTEQFEDALDDSVEHDIVSNELKTIRENLINCKEIEDSDNIVPEIIKNDIVVSINNEKSKKNCNSPDLT